MRVLFLNHEYPPIGGGSGVAMKYLADALAADGHVVSVLTVGLEDEWVKENGVEVRRFPIYLRKGELAGLRSWLSFLYRAPSVLADSIQAFQPDVVNTHFVFPSGFVLSRDHTPCAHVTSVVGADIHDPTRKVSADNNVVVRMACKRAVRHADITTTPSLDLTRRTQQFFPEADVRTIPWGVPLLEPREEAIPFAIPDNAFIISSLCRMVPRKRLQDLLHAVAEMNDQRVHVILMGSGPTADDLKALAKDLTIDRQVTFAGHVSDEVKGACLEVSDVFCLPSEHEGFGLVYLEAMGLACPVIASDVGGQTDFIHHGDEGYLVSVGDTHSIARHLTELLNDPFKLAMMKEFATERAKKHTPIQTAGQFLRIYEEAIRSAR